jgi:hypothetical protein
MMGLITYTAAVPVRVRSPYSAAVSFWDELAASQLTDIVPAGTEVSVLLDWGYTTLDPKRKDTRFTPSTPTGHVEVISHGFREGWKFSVDFVKQDRTPGMANDFEALNSLNDHLAQGTVRWFPDFENFPDESVLVVADKIYPPKRTRNLDLWQFTFDLWQVPASQVSNTLASLVTV